MTARCYATLGGARRSVLTLEGDYATRTGLGSQDFSALLDNQMLNACDLLPELRDLISSSHRPPPSSPSRLLDFTLFNLIDEFVAFGEQVVDGPVIAERYEHEKVFWEETSEKLFDGSHIFVLISAFFSDIGHQNAIVLYQHADGNSARLTVLVDLVRDGTDVSSVVD